MTGVWFKWLFVLLALAVLVLASIVMNWQDVADWGNKFFAAHPNVVTVIVGVASSLVASVCFGVFQKQVWHKDKESLDKGLDEVKKAIIQLNSAVVETKQGFYDAAVGVRQGIAEADKNYRDLVTILQKAIVGPFTASVLGYHPRSSEKIAEILSVETRKAYDKHWDRVVVINAADRYLITQIKEFTLGEQQPEAGVLVWELDYQVSWTWRNDSKVTRRPLEDLVIIIVAPEDAVRDFDPSDPEGASKKYAEFFAGALNCVKCVVANPHNHEKRLPEDAISQLFRIQSIKFIQGSHSLTLKVDELVEENGQLPPGVYKQLKIPREKVGNFILEIEHTMEVVYEGVMSTPVHREKDGTFVGYLAYVPSDIVADSFELSLSHPKQLIFNNQGYQTEVVPDVSGCQYLRDPLRYNPEILSTARHLPEKFRPGDKRQVSQIKINETLTHFHLLKLNWKASPAK